MIKKNMKQIDKDTLLLVKWQDSYSSAHWFTDIEIEKWIGTTDEEITSVGFLYKQAKEYIVIYGDKTIDEKMRLLKIPTACISSISVGLKWSR